jgi:hypothetical protein
VISDRQRDRTGSEPGVHPLLDECDVVLRDALDGGVGLDCNEIDVVHVDVRPIDRGEVDRGPIDAARVDGPAAIACIFIAIAHVTVNARMDRSDQWRHGACGIRITLRPWR